MQHIAWRKKKLCQWIVSQGYLERNFWKSRIILNKWNAGVNDVDLKKSSWIVNHFRSEIKQCFKIIQSFFFLQWSNYFTCHGARASNDIDYFCLTTVPVIFKYVVKNRIKSDCKKKYKYFNQAERKIFYSDWLQNIKLGSIFLCNFLYYFLVPSYMKF